ncbi:hypothetical protein QT971_06300 [Microcoleus sp. herbarium19]|uniref:hypothetical protein n=1 Tax=Microcoleus sp. herbarium19 TaxID=3055440 RepID=UPI002FD35FBF
MVVPFNARYSFPSQANKAGKMTPRITPKSGSDYLPGSIIRLEFPAQGYVNPANTTLEFDVLLRGPTTPSGSITRIQNNVQSIFSRVRVMYGSTPLEDIIKYNQIVRMLTEWTGPTQIGTLDQTSICEGIGGVVFGAEGATLAQLGANGTGRQRKGLVNIRQAYIQGLDYSTNSTTTMDDPSTFNVTYDALFKGKGFGLTPHACNVDGNQTDSGTWTRRRYQISFAMGLFTQQKLIPTKFMASQFAIELTLAPPEECLFVIKGDPGGLDATYKVMEVNLIPEILEFDSSYDAVFLKGLQKDGVPIKVFFI